MLSARENRLFQSPVNIFEHFRGYVPSPNARHVSVNKRMARHIAQGRPDFLGKDSGRAERKIPVDHGYFFGLP